jgi:HAE1 family hydrophobic/amphiphilic exporter-1
LKIVKKEFFPLVDEGRFLVRFETPVGSSFEYTEQKTREVEEVIRKNPYVDRFGLAMGQGVAGRPTVNGGLAFVYLVDRSKRPHQREVMEMMRRELAKIKDIRVSVESASIIGPAGGRQVDLQYVIKGPDIEELQRISERLIAEFRGKARLQGHRHRPKVKRAPSVCEGKQGKTGRPWAECGTGFQHP